MDKDIIFVKVVSKNYIEIKKEGDKYVRRENTYN